VKCKTTDSEQKEVLCLKFRKEDAKQQIEAQILEGENIKSSEIMSYAQLDEARKHYSRWFDYNSLLLNRLFSNSDIAEEYNGMPSPPRHVRGNFSIDRNDFLREVDLDINSLKSIIDRLKLIPECDDVKSSKSEECEPDIHLIEHLCKRIQYSANILSNRTRPGKLSYKIEDEYDVQDLVHAVLRAYLKYSVQEDTMNKVAGTRSGRVDISIEELGLLIEIKFSRRPDDNKVFFDAFSKDLVLYSSWAPLKHLFYIIYNHNLLKDPEGLEKLSGKKEISGKKFEVKVILA